MKHSARLFLTALLAVIFFGNTPIFAEVLAKTAVFKRVKAGMTQAQVLELVGKPAAKKTRKKGGEIWIYSEKTQKVSPPKPDLPYPTPEKSMHESKLRVFFNASGQAVNVQQIVSSEEAHSRLLPGVAIKKTEAKAENKAEMGS
ncbi:MAG: hypothetical protein A2Y02_00050 [Omnitrophica bacterium GWA2_52_12]|nr:MAG: hypothetical protein A2Y02_00050 [Omnitrophica bacterium GWA2_52_12]